MCEYLNNQPQEETMKEKDPPKAKKTPTNGRRRKKGMRRTDKAPPVPEPAPKDPDKPPYTDAHGPFEGKYVMRVHCTCGEMYSYDAELETSNSPKNETFACPECKKATSVEQLLPFFFRAVRTKDIHPATRVNNPFQPPPTDSPAQAEPPQAAPAPKQKPTPEQRELIERAARPATLEAGLASWVRELKRTEESIYRFLPGSQAEQAATAQLSSMILSNLSAMQSLQATLLMNSAEQTIKKDPHTAILRGEKTTRPPDLTPVFLDAPPFVEAKEPYPENAPLPPGFEKLFDYVDVPDDKPTFYLTKKGFFRFSLELYRLGIAHGQSKKETFNIKNEIVQAILNAGGSRETAKFYQNNLKDL
jgi:hypothetical protein